MPASQEYEEFVAQLREHSPQFRDGGASTR